VRSDEAAGAPSHSTVTIAPADGGLTTDGTCWWDGKRWQRIDGAITGDGNSWWNGEKKQWQRMHNKVGDHGVYVAVVAALIGVAAVVLAGSIAAVFLNKTVPTAVIAIGASAISGLVGLLAPSPLSRGGATGTSQANSGAPPS